ncbi:UBX domain-containing protein 6 [Conger conger]|uniref:UBX domain-containing protein 6 n=1 Tax=Conger conger TaxID=82655 RepID=UPI002A5A681F|nr:UBX domain-containing protein 6 [Conger conger]
MTAADQNSVVLFLPRGASPRGVISTHPVPMNSRGPAVRSSSQPKPRPAPTEGAQRVGVAALARIQQRLQPCPGSSQTAIRNQGPVGTPLAVLGRCGSGGRGPRWSSWRTFRPSAARARPFHGPSNPVPVSQEVSQPVECEVGDPGSHRSEREKRGGARSLIFGGSDIEWTVLVPL